jgi:hypothetical protein
MHFCFDTGEMDSFKYGLKVMHFCFDTKNFCFDTENFVTPLVIKGCFSTNSISNIYY